MESEADCNAAADLLGIGDDDAFVLSHCNRERHEGGSLLDRTAFARAGSCLVTMLGQGCVCVGVLFLETDREVWRLVCLSGTEVAR